MNDARISTIIPVFNGERYLEETLASVLGQTRPPNEVIVVDDGSTDGSADIVASFGDRVSYTYRGNRGAASARNLGFARSTGEFVSFIDQDDLWHPEKLERQLACFAERPDTDLCVTFVELRWIDELADEALLYRDHPRGHRVPGYSTPTLLARRSAFERVGPLDTGLRFADATDWFLRAVDLGLVVVLLPDVLLYHRMHENNLTRSTDRREYLRVVRASLERRRQGSGGGRA